MINGLAIIALFAALSTAGVPVKGLVENRPSDAWVVLEFAPEGSDDPMYMDYPTALFPCDPHEGQKFFGTIRSNGKLLITKCVETQ